VHSGVQRRVEVTEKWMPVPIESVVPAELISPRDTGFEVRVDGETLLFRKAHALTKLSGSKEIRLPMGKDGRLGPARVLSRPLVEATVEVRNAFGNVHRASKAIALPFGFEAPEHASLTLPSSEVGR
jgi:hypothetical protein